MENKLELPSHWPRQPRQTFTLAKVQSKIVQWKCHKSAQTALRHKSIFHIWRRIHTTAGEISLFRFDLHIFLFYATDSFQAVTSKRSREFRQLPKDVTSWQSVAQRWDILATQGLPSLIFAALSQKKRRAIITDWMHHIIEEWGFC